ncbi:MAG TPA: metal ABC transporter permease [Trueperaceae bacterium]|nr:metal ABC transporter permease [Trueperaceae bacterium]
MQPLLDDVAFVVTATGVLTAAAAALVGSVLVVRGQAMLTDAVSHGVVFGIAATFLVTGAVSGPVQLLGATAAGVLTVVLTQALAGSGRVRRDAATGLVFPALFAAGVLVLSLFARDVHVDTHTVLLGEIGFVWLERVPLLGLEVPRAPLVLLGVLVLDALYVLAFHERLVAGSFDPVHARLQGLRPGAASLGLLVLVALTAVAALDAVGVVLFVAFAIVPAVAARLVAGSMVGVIAVAVAAASAAAVAGYPLAVSLDVSIGGTMALLTAVPLAAASAWRLARSSA